MVEDPARGADDQGNALLQAVELLADALAAVDRQRAAVAAGGQLGGLLADLDDQLAGRRQHDGLRAGSVVVAPGVEEGNEKGSSLAGPGLGLSDDVTPLQCLGYQGRLDGSGFVILGTLQGGKDRCVER